MKAFHGRTECMLRVACAGNVPPTLPIRSPGSSSGAPPPTTKFGQQMDRWTKFGQQMDRWTKFGDQMAFGQQIWSTISIWSADFSIWSPNLVPAIWSTPFGQQMGSVPICSADFPFGQQMFPFGQQIPPFAQQIWSANCHLLSKWAHLLSRFPIWSTT